MDCFDVIVIGSGPGAAFAAYGARGRRVVVLDAGFGPSSLPGLKGNFYDLRRSVPDLFDSLIGERFESLHNLHNRTISLKLKSPGMSFIVRDSERLTPVASKTFAGVVSLAKGGLANGWGAGVFRFTSRDLDGFPVTADELAPYYDELTEHIGVSGTNDDLEPYFVRDDRLQQPLCLSPLFAEFYERYQRERALFHREKVFIGRPRLAVLTEPHRGRAPYAYDNLEFFKPHNPAIYTPAYTIDEMIRSGVIDYKGSKLALRYREHAEGVDVTVRNIQSNQEETFRGRTLCIGAGAINTARIVLQSNDDFETRLPLLDNPMACIPFFQLSRIGAPISPIDNSVGQLNLVAEDDELGEAVQATIYGTSGPLRSDMLLSLPLTIRGNMVWSKHLTAAMGLAMTFFPRDEDSGSYLRLRQSGELEIEFSPEMPHGVEQRLVRLIKKLGYLTHPALIQRPGLGAGIHYAASLPMRAQPGRYQTDSNGKLAGTNSVYIVDGACMSRLPAKNLTFTIMANALRIGRRVAAELA